MSSLPKSSKSVSQSQGSTQIQSGKSTKAIKESTLKSTRNKPPARQSFPVWQITAPLGIVLIFAMGSLTAYFMTEGRFIFDLHISSQQIRMRADVNKTKGIPSAEKSTMSNPENE